VRRQVRDRGRLGDYYAVSDLSGVKYFASEMVFKEGQNGRLFVHKDEFERKHPQAHLRPIMPDKITPKIIRPRQELC